jgi:quinol monooxygenase YgiN
MNALQEKQKEILQTLISVLETAENEHGNLSYGIFNDIEDSNVFSLISEWDNRHDLNRHMRSDRFSVLLGTKSLLSEPLKIQIHTVAVSEGIQAVADVRKNKPVFPKIMGKG